MENITLCSKILEIAILVFPSLITLLVLLNKRFYTKNITQLRIYLEEFKTKTQEDTKIILNKIQQQQKILTKLLSNKTVAEKIRQITKYAIQYCNNDKMSKILANFTQQIIQFVNSVIDEGFGSQVKEQLISRFQLAKDNSLTYLKNFVSEQNYKIWLDMQTPICQEYVKALIDIYDDPINDKNSRFLIKTLDYTQILTRKFITFVSIIKKRNRKLNETTNN